VYAIHPYYMLTDYDIKLLLSLKILQIQQAIPILKHCELIINCKDNILNICTQNPNTVSLLRFARLSISQYAYLKIGCSQVAVYLQSNCLSRYDTNVSAAIVDNKTMTFTLDKPAAETTQVSTNPNWFSFAQVAQTVSEYIPGVSLSPDDVAEKIEQYNLPCKIHQGQLGIEKDTLKQFLDKLINSFKEQVMNRLAPKVRNIRSSRRGIAEPVAAEQKIESNLENGSSPAPAATAEFVLSSDFGERVMNGRHRKPPVELGLKLAIDELNGISQRDALTAIAFNRPEAESFINDLAEFFKSNSRSHTKAMEEIADAAVALLRNGDAAA
jgi:hypothetical protein